MKVKELIEQLKVLDQEAEVTTDRPNNDGCGTCGYGESSTELCLSSITDLETRVVLVFEY